ncbi:MAG: ribonuclease P protein subunit [Candidatus Bathyarchaeota archaeon]
MISISEERLSRHELIGLSITVLHSSNPLHLGVKGVVVDETKNMLVIAVNTKKKYIPKEVATFSFSMPEGTFIEIDGRQLLGRPVDRIGRTSGRRRL